MLDLGNSRCSYFCIWDDCYSLYSILFLSVGCLCLLYLNLRNLSVFDRSGSFLGASSLATIFPCFSSLGCRHRRPLRVHPVLIPSLPTSFFFLLPLPLPSSSLPLSPIHDCPPHPPIRDCPSFLFIYLFILWGKNACFLVSISRGKSYDLYLAWVVICVKPCTNILFVKCLYSFFFLFFVKIVYLSCLYMHA